MDWRDLPPLSALRAFSAFVETGNLVKAGAALGVSHGAISQQLRGLEEHLDVALLDRSGRALRLTPEGKQLGEALHAGFGGMIEAVQQITGVQDARPLHISTTPTFAASSPSRARSWGPRPAVAATGSTATTPRSWSTT